MNTCEVEVCDRVRVCRGHCNAHYLQILKHGKVTRPQIKIPVTQRDPDGRKWCYQCREWLPESTFNKNRAAKDGLQSKCRGCASRRYRASADDIRDKMREQRFKLTREAFDALLAKQGGCAICGATEPGRTYWHVDHDHTCCPGSEKTCGNCVRGILCGTCNIGLGAFKDDPDRLTSAARYLQDSRASVTRGIG